MDPGYLDRTPSRDPPPGQESNFTNPESRSHQLYILIAVLSPIIVLVGSLRIYSRLRITRSFGVDDWLCIVATDRRFFADRVATDLMNGNTQFSGSQVVGSLADSVLIRITNTTIKVAFLTFYLRLFSPVTYVRYMVLAGMALVITFCVVFVIVDLVACAPWPSEHGDWIAPSLIDRCTRISVPLITAAAYFTVITDFYVLLIPLHQIPTLGLSPRRKVGVSIIFLTGLLATGAALTNLIIRQDKKIFDRSDFTWTIVPVYMTSLVEINIGLICLSLPVIFVLFLGRFTNISRSVRSWIRQRQSPHQSSNESVLNFTPSDSEAPRIQSTPSDTSLSGLRKLIHNVYRSGARSSARGTNVTTYDELISVDLNYHAHLKTMKARETEKTHGSGQA
ncbi:hypothetical protein Daesc_000106 [Daldinia eschscholtzii]|uniref:Rhodopsin domain-containing protein n=1 Tax=Daldinia eschscholtzii TaxID=292717 RepID=A0AAX6MY20_9PEZI